MSAGSAPSSLYRRWCAVVGNRGDELAVREVAGRLWTVRELAEALASEPRATQPLIVEAKGAPFLIQTLRAWRDGMPLFPIEPGGCESASALVKGLPEGVAHLKLTSGTTAEPRAVLFKAEQLAADGDQIVSTMGLDHHGPNVAAISLAHSYGFSNLVLPLLLHGRPLVLTDGPLPASVDAALDLAGGDAVLPAVPAMWQAWSAAGILDSDRIGLAISAGAPLRADLEREVFNACGVKVHNFLGSTECGGIAFDRSHRPRRDSRVVGTAMDGVELSLDPAGALTVTSPAVGLRYWPDSRPDRLGAGRLVTSDLAEITSDGDIQLLGRAGDSINVAGRKASPAEIESVIAGIEGVSCCVVFGVPSRDAGRNEEIVACVNGELAETALKELAGTGLPAWKVPRRWWLCEDLCPDGRGKIARRVWRERYLAESAG